MGPYLVIRASAQHPDIGQRPVQLTVSTPCATLLNVQLKSTDPITIGLQVPTGQPMVHWSVKVSRTFQPSDFGAEDQRHLGATVSEEFTASAERFRKQEHTAVLSPCLL
jgi:hypothetical protein